jgi:pimeloyl-ACP methyl ester carboxylesterase
MLQLFMTHLRILCLHGYHGSAVVLRRQMAAFTTAMPADVEFVYVDAPSLAEGDFGWWHAGSGGWQRTREWANRLFRSADGFDGVFGFSQGAALAGLLAGLQQARSGDANHDIRFTFALMVGGFKSDAADPHDLFDRQLTVPSIHVIGRTDMVVPPNESRLLAEAFVDPLVLEHGGGHVIPGDPAVTGPIAAFLKHVVDDHRHRPDPTGVGR